MIPAAIALEMSECDVVKRAGIAEKVEIGTNERRERTATLTYIRGQRPGIYHFTAGRLAVDGARARAGTGEAGEEAGQARQARGPAEPGFGSISPEHGHVAPDMPRNESFAALALAGRCA